MITKILPSGKLLDICCKAVGMALPPHESDGAECWVSSSCEVWWDGLNEAFLAAQTYARSHYPLGLYPRVILDILHEERKMISLPLSHHSVVWKKYPRPHPLEKKTSREKKTRKSWRKKLNQAPALATRLWRSDLYHFLLQVVVPPYFVRLIQSLTLVSQVLLLASKICLYLDVWNPIMLSREKLIVSPFVSSGRTFEWLRPWEVFHVKTIGVPVCWFACCYTYALKAYKTCPTYSKKSTICVVRSPRTCPLLGQNMFINICLMHVFFFRDWATICEVLYF